MAVQNGLQCFSDIGGWVDAVERQKRHCPGFGNEEERIFCAFPCSFCSLSGTGVRRRFARGRGGPARVGDVKQGDKSLNGVALAKMPVEWPWEGALGLVLEAGLVAPQYHEPGDEGDRDDGQDGCTGLPGDTMYLLAQSEAC
jgi:hypothetical protein